MLRTPFYLSSHDSGLRAARVHAAVRTHCRTNSPDVTGSAMQGRGGQRTQALEFLADGGIYRILSVGASRWRSSRHERGTSARRVCTRCATAHLSAPRAHRSRHADAIPLTVAPVDASGAQRFVARTAARACASAPPIGRRQLSVPRPPMWLIALGSIHARNAARESAHRNRLERWPRSMARDDHLGGPSAHSTPAETPWLRRESRGPGGGERSSGCHRSPGAARLGPPTAAS